jgi:hypothetical protein
MLFKRSVVMGSWLVIWKNWLVLKKYSPGSRGVRSSDGSVAEKRHGLGVGGCKRSKRQDIEEITEFIVQIDGVAPQSWVF